MEWYLPVTIIPGIGMIVLSTSSIMLALNGEITQLESAEIQNIEIIQAKLSQLKRLSISIVFQYVGVLLFLVSGIINAILPDQMKISETLLLVGVIVVSVSIIILLIYSIKAVTIRQKHLKI